MGLLRFKPYEGMNECLMMDECQAHYMQNTTVYKQCWLMARVKAYIPEPMHYSPSQ